MNLTSEGVYHAHPRFLVLHPLLYHFGTLVHEAAHSFEATLSDSFFAQWNSFVDTSIYYEKGTVWDRPRGGFLSMEGVRGPCDSRYHEGSLRYHEDFATWVEDINTGYSCLKKADVFDVRYWGKLHLLRNVDVISQEQFDSAKALLGSEYRR